MREQNIYSIDGFATSDILNRLDDIDEKIDELNESEEFTKEKEFDLIYQKFIAGLRLSTGIRHF